VREVAHLREVRHGGPRARNGKPPPLRDERGAAAAAAATLAMREKRKKGSGRDEEGSRPSHNPS